MKVKELFIAFTVLVLLSSSAAGQDQKTTLKPEEQIPNEGLTIEDVVNGAIGPFDFYSDGYGNPGATGLEYISVRKILISIEAYQSSTKGGRHYIILK